jgi:hypothetical protein
MSKVFKNQIKKEFEAGLWEQGLTYQNASLIWNAFPFFHDRVKRIFTDNDHNIDFIWRDWSKYDASDVLKLVLRLPRCLGPLISLDGVDCNWESFVIPQKVPIRKNDYNIICDHLRALEVFAHRYGPGGSHRDVVPLIQDTSVADKGNGDFLETLEMGFYLIPKLRRVFETALEGLDNRVPYRKGKESLKTVVLKVGLMVSFEQKNVLGQPLYKAAISVAHMLTFPDEPLDLDDNTLRKFASSQRITNK